MLRTLSRAWNRHRLSLEPMWFLRGAPPLEARGIEPRVAKALDDIRKDGVAILESNIPAAMCDEVIDQGQPRFFHNRYEGNFDEA